MVSSERLKVLSVCTNYPTRNYPTLGLFVQRRLDAMSRICDLRVLVPQPAFPFLRSRKEDRPVAGTVVAPDIRRMFYIPKIANHWNGMWMERCVNKWLSKLPRDLVDNAVLDAHFGFPEGVGIQRIAKGRNVPFFVTLRGLETDLFQIPSIRGQLIEALNQATGVIAVSESLKITAVENGIAEDKICVIGNGVDGDFYSPASKATSRKKLDVSSETKLIVSVGTIRRLKGFDLLVDAVESFGKDPKFKCVILGKIMEHNFHDELARRITEKGLDKKVLLLGPQHPEKVLEWLRAADMFVLPTRREGCCNAVLEALSAGIPVVTTPAGDNTKFIADGVNGFIVPHENPLAISQAIERVFNHSWVPNAVSSSVRSYTWEGTADKVIKYFHERLGR